MKSIYSKYVALGAVLLVAFASNAQTAVTDAAQPQVVRTNDLFQFKGGNLHAFVDSIGTEFGVNLEEIATIPPDSWSSIEVPKMRLKTRNYVQVLELYNDVSQESDFSMGRWIIRNGPGGLPEASVIILNPAPHSRREADMAVRAFSLSMGDKDFQNLRETIEEEVQVLRAELLDGRYPGGQNTEVRGRLSFHKATSTLVVTGTKTYVDLAAEIIGAYRERYRMRDIVIPGQPVKGENKDPQDAK